MTAAGPAPSAQPDGNQHSPRMRAVWRKLYVATFIYGALTIAALWVFTRAFRY